MTAEVGGRAIDLLREAAAATPDQLAVVAHDGTLDWARLDAWSDAIASAVTDAPAGPAAAGTPSAEARPPVGLLVGAGALSVAALHGALRSGRPTLLLDARLTPAELATRVDAAGVRSVAMSSTDGDVAALPPQVARILLPPEPPEPPGPRRAAGRAIAPALGELIVPTSGSTSRPKLVRLPADRLLASAGAWNAVLPAASAWLLSLGLAHVAGIGIVLRAALAGVPVVVPDGPRAAQLLAAITAARATGIVVSHVSLVSAQLAGLLEATPDGRPPGGVLAAIMGGGPIPVDLVRRASRAGWPVVPSYGLTETASGVVALIESEVADAPGAAGRPLPGVDVRLDDAEILVRGPMTFAGYLGDPAATAAVLDDAGWVRTGDLGRIDEAGRLVVDGRRDDVIIRGGENLAPSEVEAALADHPSVADVAVIGFPDATWGQVPVAVVAVAGDRRVDDDELRAHVRARLAGPKVPQRFVRVPRIPRTALGKVAREEVRRLVELDPRPAIIRTSDGQRLATIELGPPDAPTIVLLHATLSTSSQLLGLARRLADDRRIVLIDRRGSGASLLPAPAKVPVERHAADVIETLDALGIDRATLVGHSFGGVVALRTAIRAPERSTAVVVWEPPYLALADATVREGMTAMTNEVARRFEAEGPTAAARLFLESVAGPDAWERLHPRQRDALGREGSGVLADVAMGGLATEGLATLRMPVIIGTGALSEPFYRPIAEALAQAIGPNAVRVDLVGLRHPAPITDPDAIAQLVRRVDVSPMIASTQETAP